MSKPRIIRLSAYETIEQAHQRLDGVYLENEDFQKIIARYDRNYAFFFCDPPYWQAADYGVPFEWKDHERLAASLRGIKGKFLLTINDHPDIRKLYKDFKFCKIPVRYSVQRTGDQKTHELIYANYPLPKKINI